MLRTKPAVRGYTLIEVIVVITLVSLLMAATSVAAVVLLTDRKLLGTREWFVIHHTNCGMELFTDEIIRDLLSKSLETAQVDEKGWHDVGRGPGSRHGDFIDWLTIRDQAESVATDVDRIRSHPLVPAYIPISGFIYNVQTGGLIEVPRATEVGRSKAA